LNCGVARSAHHTSGRSAMELITLFCGFERSSTSVRTSCIVGYWTNLKHHCNIPLRLL
jgi:hypothetical protein